MAQGADEGGVRSAQDWVLIHRPAYSPDFAPVKLAFAKAQAYLRQVALPQDGPNQAIAEALAWITPRTPTASSSIVTTLYPHNDSAHRCRAHPRSTASLGYP